MDPLIFCILPCHNHDTIARAVNSFRSQTYRNKRLIIWDNSENRPWHYTMDLPDNESCVEDVSGLTVGDYRNHCIEWALEHRDIDYISHYDHDDVSGPDRLILQLAHIQKTGKLLTGFYDMAMYDVKNDKTWIYSNEDHRYALGTSLFYRREAWERVKFPDLTPEDNKWRKEVGLDNCESRSGFREDGSPIMVQTVHGGNASARIFPSSHRYKTPTAEQDRQIRELLK